MAKKVTQREIQEQINFTMKTIKENVENGESWEAVVRRYVERSQNGRVRIWEEKEQKRREINWLKTQMNVMRQEIRDLKKKVRKKWGYVYLMKGGEYYKIGMSTRPPQRTYDISPKMPFEVELIHIIESENARKLEAELHQHFKELHLRGEWFDLGEHDIEYIKGLSNNGK